MTRFDEVLTRARSLVQAIDDRAGAPDGLCDLKETSAGSDDADAAAALLQDLIEKFPRPAEPYRLLCRLNLSLQRWQRAADVARLSQDAGVRIAIAGDLAQANRFKEALDVIEITRALVSDDPGLLRLEMIAARALDAMGREEEAIEHYSRAAMLKPDDTFILQRLTIYDREHGHWPQCRPRLLEIQKVRAPLLPPTLAEGLQALWQEAGKSPSIRPGLAWAWEHADHGKWNRGDWLAAADWGARAHQLMVEWWRWAPERADEILALVDPPDLAPIREALAQGRGCILACAHIGATAAGVEFLQQSDLPFTSVGFAGSERAAYRECERRMTITANATAAARAVVNGLKGGDAVAWSVDSPVGNTVTFEFLGRPLRWVAAAPKIAARYASASFWCQALWRGERIVFEIERLPDTVADESEADWTRRWYSAYLSRLEQVIRGDPRNLLGMAGMWLAFSPLPRFGAAQALEARALERSMRNFSIRQPG